MGTNVKHTPGPWVVEPTDHTRVWDGTCHIAQVAGSCRENTDANARLIAAAPDLLAALRGALRELVTPKGLPDVGKGRTTAQQAALDAARAAIARATT